MHTANPSSIALHIGNQLLVAKQARRVACSGDYSSRIANGQHWSSCVLSITPALAPIPTLHLLLHCPTKKSTIELALLWLLRVDRNENKQIFFLPSLALRLERLEGAGN